MVSHIRVSLLISHRVSYVSVGSERSRRVSAVASQGYRASQCGASAVVHIACKRQTAYRPVKRSHRSEDSVHAAAAAVDDGFSETSGTANLM